MKAIVSEGQSDALVIQKIIELRQQETGTKQGIPPIKYLDPKSFANPQQTLNLNGENVMNIIYTRGNTHLYRLVCALFDQYQEQNIEILLIYDLDSKESEHHSNTQKLINALDSSKQLQERQSQGYLDCFTFQEDLEGFLIEYLESNRPDWYRNVCKCTEPWLKCLNARPVFSDWKSNKNKEALLRLIYQAQNADGAHYGLFPESFFECFGMFWNVLIGN